jgi:hypothetical protein
MKSLLVTVVVSAILASVGAGVLEACGAKFLVATRAARFQKMQRAKHPANILVYQHSDDPQVDDAGVAEFAEVLRAMLEKVGHTVTVVPTEDALRSAARTNDFSVVMMELQAARRLNSDVREWSPGAQVLPMGQFLSRSQAALAKEEFGQVIRLPAKDSEVLSSVDESNRRN